MNKIKQCTVNTCGRKLWQIVKEVAVFVMMCGSLKDIAQLNQAGEGFADLQPLKVEKKVWTDKKLDRPSVRMTVRIKMPLCSLFSTSECHYTFCSEPQNATTWSVLNLKMPLHSLFSTSRCHYTVCSRPQNATTQSVLHLKMPLHSPFSTSKCRYTVRSQAQNAATQSVLDLKTLAEITKLQ
jgi:hypothetical protein